MSRASYARARRAKPQEEEVKKPSVIKPIAEKVAKKVYEKGKPIVDTVKKGTVKVLDGYLKGTNAIADKVKKVLPEEMTQPRYSNRTHRRR